MARSHDPFNDLEIPAELQQSLQNHREHLARLARSLRSAGIEESQIEDSVSTLIASYKTELILAMKRLVA